MLLELLSRSRRTVGELGTRLGMDTGTLTPLQKRLQAAGVVTRTRDLNDESRVLVDLTHASRAIETQVLAVNRQIKSACGLTQAEMLDLHRTLETLGRTPAD